MTRAPVILGLVIAILPGWGRGEEVSIDFATGVFDRLIFRPDYGFGYGRWESRGQGLRATIPPGVTGRNAMHFDCLLQLEGDFEVTTEFVINRLTKPRAPKDAISPAPRNSIEIRLNSGGRAAEVHRSHGTSGEVFGAFGESPDGGFASPPYSARTKSGRIGIRRVGGRIVFLRADAGRALTEFGSTEFGTGPVSGLGIYVNPLGTVDAIDVRFKRLDITADRLVRLGLLGGVQDFDSPTLVTVTSRHPSGVNLAVADGSVRFVKSSVSPQVWAALGTVAGGEAISADSY
jgi:Protein of unknown function (DUF1559)